MCGPYREWKSIRSGHWPRLALCDGSYTFGHQGKVIPLTLTAFTFPRSSTSTDAPTNAIGRARDLLFTKQNLLGPPFFEKAWNPVNVALIRGLVLVLCCLLWKEKKRPRTSCLLIFHQNSPEMWWKLKNSIPLHVCLHSLFCFVYKTLSTWVWRYSCDYRVQPHIQAFFVGGPVPSFFSNLKYIFISDRNYYHSAG